MDSSLQLYEQAWKLYQFGEIKQCLDFLSEHEEELGAAADYVRGQIYASVEYSEDGIRRNERKAAQYYKKAAALGHTNACYELGKMYASGSGVKKSLNKAVEFLEKASQQGDEIATFELANLFYDNEQHPGAEKAIPLYEALTKTTFKRNSLLKLGRIYLRGKFGAKDPARGIALLEEAAELGNKSALMDLAYVYYRGEHVERDLDKALEYVEFVGSDHLMYEEIVELIRAAQKS